MIGSIGRVALIAVLAFFTSAAVAQTASTSPALGPPGTAITVTGAGFDRNTLVDIYFDTTDLALTTSNASGAVSFPITAPASAQPGTHWITISERRTDAAAQVAFLVSTNWAQTGFGPSKRSWNPFENTINTGNVAQLTRVWSSALDGYANSKPPLVFNNLVYIRDADQVVRSFSQSGKLLWHATTPFSEFPDALTPATGFGLVFFSDLNGNVIAYKQNCRSDGGVCAPSWTTKIGAAVEGGLTLNGNALYVPAADGSVHVLTPATGHITNTISVTSNALTTWVAFGADGGGYVGSGSAMAESKSVSGASSFATYSGALSSPAVGADTAYSTESDGILREMQYSWTATLLSSGCTSPPAYADSVVYAGSCNSIGAYDSGTGRALWTITTAGSVQGLTYANGVLFACVNNRLVAYYASYGGTLWTGGYCSAAPVVVNGMLYSSFATMNAYALNGAQTTVGRRPPDPHSLKRTIPVRELVIGR